MSRAVIEDLVRGVVRLLHGGTDPAAVADLVSVALGPVPHRSQVRAGGATSGLLHGGGRTAASLFGGLRDVRLQRLLQRRPVLSAQVDGPRLPTEAERHLLR